MTGAAGSAAHAALCKKLSSSSTVAGSSPCVPPMSSVVPARTGSAARSKLAHAGMPSPSTVEPMERAKIWLTDMRDSR